MKLVVFGLAVSSSWGNGHATLWRGLGRALGRAGHRLCFFEREQPFYAAHRDATELPGMALVIYPHWSAVQARADAELADADAGMVTSYCPDAGPATAALFSSKVPVRCFYDLDTPVTLATLAGGQPVPYLPPGGLAPFDLVLSFTGGAALEQLRSQLGARRVAPLYGSVDPDAHRPAAPHPELLADLSYLGTYSADRQQSLDRLLIQPARRRPQRRFLIAGAQYPEELGGQLPANVRLLPHVPPPMHPALYASAPLSLNVTRGPMAALGFCPSARLFEAAACERPVLSDAWPGLEEFFEPGREILVAASDEQALAAIDLGEEQKAAVGRRARARTLAEHTAAHRAAELDRLLASSAS